MDNKSNNYILAKYDVSGIQSYIFATNRLRENAGASYQVTRVLEEFLPEAIEAEQLVWSGDDAQGKTVPKDGTNTVITDWENQKKLKLPLNERIQAEIIYIGGGNAVVLYREKEMYLKVGQKMGKRVAADCQGIYLAAAYIETKLTSFKNDMDKLNKALAERKRDMIRQPICSPFPVVELDSAEHQPITHRIQYSNHAYEDKDITEIQSQKRAAYQQMKNWWSKEKKSRAKRLLQDTMPNRQVQGFQRLYPTMQPGADYDYPEEMYKLCRKQGEDSYVAVVHIDGNGMGEQINVLLKEHEEYDKGVPALRNKSKDIDLLFGRAYEEVFRKLSGYKDILVADKNCKENIIFPLRPIILDGDDFTFLCTADLAIPIAAGFMTQLSAIQKGTGGNVTACAGIAFVHSHFPFYEAYSIAEESCSKAKAKWYEEKKTRMGASGESPGESYLDFQLIRESEIGAFQRNHNLQCRPYAVFGQSGKPGTLKCLFNTLREMEENWPSNRLHKIYRAMLEGKKQVELLDKEFQSRGYQLEKLTGTDEWNHSPLFDALEIRGMCRTELLQDFLIIQDEVSK